MGDVLANLGTPRTCVGVGSCFKIFCLDFSLTLIMGKKLKCQVILLRNEMRHEITKCYLYQTLFVYQIKVYHLRCAHLNANGVRKTKMYKTPKYPYS